MRASAPGRKSRISRAATAGLARDERPSDARCVPSRERCCRSLLLSALQPRGGGRASLWRRAGRQDPGL